MTYEEKLQKIKLNRSIALNTEIYSLNAQAVALDENNFNDKYLWGDGTYKGVQDIILEYYNELNLEVGRDFSYPTLGNYTQTYWNNTIFINALSTSGDGSHGFYPNGATSTLMQTSNNNYYIYTNGDDGFSTGGIVGYINSIISAIGTVAANADNGTDGMTYATVLDATNAANAWILANNRLGSGLLGKRTENIEISTTGAPPSVSFSVGTGGADTPSYYSDPEKTTLLNSISSLITASSNLLSTLNNLYTDINDIKVGSNPLFNDPNMAADVNDDRTSITNLITAINTAIGTNADIVTDNTYWGYYNWFSSAVGNEANFNTYLGDLNTLNTSYNSTITTRAGNIHSIIGNGSIDYNSGLRKWRTFWIITIIGKPIASLITYNALQIAIDNAVNSLDNANSVLDVLLGTANLDQWIPTPVLYATYYNPVRTKTGIITQQRVGMVYDGQAHATKYNIYRRLTSNTPLDNTNWGDSVYSVYNAIDTNTGNISNLFEDTNIILNNSYVYRIQTVDETNDPSYSTTSLQSKVYDDSQTFTFTAITNSIQETVVVGGITYKVSKLNIGNHKFRSASYCVIKVNNTVYNDFYYIVEIDEVSISIYPQLPVGVAGNIYYTNSIVSIAG